MRIPFRRMKISHLMADTPEELEQARTALGLPESALHNAGLHNEHLDISERYRSMAIARLGAQQVSPRDMVNIIRARRAAAKESQQRPA